MHFASDMILNKVICDKWDVVCHISSSWIALALIIGIALAWREPKEMHFASDMILIRVICDKWDVVCHISSSWSASESGIQYTMLHVGQVTQNRVRHTFKFTNILSNKVHMWICKVSATHECDNFSVYPVTSIYWVTSCTCGYVKLVSGYTWQDQCVLYAFITCKKHAVAVCCSVLQCVAVCCSVLQCVAVCCSVLQCPAYIRNMLHIRIFEYMHRTHP